MKIITVMFICLMLVGTVSAAVAPAVNLAEGNDEPQQTSETTSEEPEKKTRSRRGGGACLTAVDENGRKMNLYSRFFLSRIDEERYIRGPWIGVIEFPERPAPEGMVWRALVFNGNYCLAWDKETRTIIKNALPALETSEKAISFGWWKPRP